jgi:hypothetical protein
MKYISGDLLYSGVNLFGKLSEIYLEKIKNGEMLSNVSYDFGSKGQAPTQDYSTPSLSKKSSTDDANFKLLPVQEVKEMFKLQHTVSNISATSQATTPNTLQGSSVFQMDKEIMSLFRKLQKKDAVTKIKALKSLSAYVKKEGENDMYGLDYAEQGNIT